MIKKEIYSVERVLSEIKPHTPGVKHKVDFDGDIIKMESQRYILFKRDGCKCCICGIEGTFFRKEKSIENDPYHFNLYAIDELNNEILITKDHIIPKSKGGKNIMSNYQVMCKICNNKKGNKM